MHKVLLISQMNWDSLIEIPQLLSDGGYTVDVFSKENSWVLKNNVINKWIPAADNDDQFIHQLLSFIETEKDTYNWIIPGDDIVIRNLNEHISNETLFYKVMPLTKIENRSILGSKSGFSQICSKYGIKTPGYLVYESGMELNDIEQSVKYPLLLKVDKSEGGYGVFLCNNRNDLKDNLDKIKDTTNLVIQQFIKGYDVNTEVLCHNGKLLVYSSSKTLKIMGKYGVSTERLFYNNAVLTKTLQSIAAQIGLNGFGNVVFMFDEQHNEYYLIEIDLRPNAWMYYGKYTGNDFAKAINNRLQMKDELLIPTDNYSQTQIKISLYKKDVYRCLMEKDVKTLFKWLFNTDGRRQFIPHYDAVQLKAINTFLRKTFSDMVLSKLKLKKY